MADDLLFDAAPRARHVLRDATAWRIVAPWIGTAEGARAPRGVRPPQHEHGHRELLLALDGDAVYGLGDGAYRCPAGTWLVFEPFDAHDDGYGDATADFAHLWISLVHDRAFARVYAVRGRRRIFTPAIIIDDAGEARRLIEGARVLAGDAPALARARIVGALAGLAARLLATGATSTEARGDAIDAILGHVAHCAGKGVSIDHLARIAGYSPFHFARVFRRRTGGTVHAYVDRCRREAYLALRRDGLAHGLIAERLGFSCASAFSRWLGGQRARGFIPATPPPRRPRSRPP